MYSTFGDDDQAIAT